MKTCTVLIPHVNAPHYLRACVDSIRHYAHPEVEVRIIIADQSARTLQKSVIQTYGKDPDVRVQCLPQVDAGYPIDVGVRMAGTEFFCSLDCDAFPISKNWLHVPITLIERHGFSFVGSNTGLHMAYASKGEFCHLNNYFRVSRTSVAKKVSEDVGFMRVENRKKVGYGPRDNDWGDLSCDNGVVAQWYSDRAGLGPKLALNINKYLGKTPQYGLYGMVIDDLVFHLVFGFCEEWLKDLHGALGPDYMDLRRKFAFDGITPSIIRGLTEKCVPHVGAVRTIQNKAIPDELNAEIDALIVS